MPTAARRSRTVAPAGGSGSSSSRLIDEISKLLDLSRDVTSTLDLQEVLDRSFAALHQLIAFGGGSIQLVRDDALSLAATEPPATAEALTVRIPLDQGVGGRIVATGRPTYIPDILAEARTHPKGLAKATSPGVRSFLGAPLIVAGKVIGVIQVDSPDVDAFSPESRALVLAFVPTIAAAVQNAMLHSRDHDTIEELRQVVRMKRNFLATVSHQLRTPLAPIKGFAELLAEDDHPIETSTVTDFGRRILQASDRLERLVEDLLDVSQIERGTLALQLSPTDLASIIEDALGLLRKTHTVTLRVQHGMPRVLADGDRLCQVLLNIFDNARKFSPPGSRVDVGALVQGDRVVVAVTDQGNGIPPEILPRIFERFLTNETIETRPTGSLGVGLYLARQLCEAMGIELEAESEVGLGSTFTLRIPISE